MATDLDIAWAAGLFEGEGCLRIASGGDTPVATLISTDRDVLDRFQQIVEVGRIHLRPAPLKLTHRQQWGWKASAAADVRHVIEHLSPFFGERRAAKAREVLACCERVEARVEARQNITHCPHGHEFNEENTYLLRGTKFCRPCGRGAGARYRQRLRVKRERLVYIYG